MSSEAEGRSVFEKARFSDQIRTRAKLAATAIEAYERASKELGVEVEELNAEAVGKINKGIMFSAKSYYVRTQMSENSDPVYRYQREPKDDPMTHRGRFMGFEIIDNRIVRGMPGTPVDEPSRDRMDICMLVGPLFLSEPEDAPQLLVPVTELLVEPSTFSLIF